MAPVQSKEGKAAAFVGKQLVRVPARQAQHVCTRLAPKSSRKLA